MKDLPKPAELREQAFHIWQNWMSWAASFPEKPRAFAQLGVSDQITPTTRASAHKAMAGVAELLERSCAYCSMRIAPTGFVVAMMNSVAEATPISWLKMQPTQRDAAKSVLTPCGG
jgi:hypothetical protein